MHHDIIPASSGPLLLIHGGAGNVGRAADPGPQRDAFYAGLMASLQAGATVLAAGGDALAAALAAVAELEDNPCFNAGYGGVCCADGSVELSACVMEGKRRRCGAVAGLRRCPRPAALAAGLLDHHHVLLYGSSAEDLAPGLGLPLVSPTSLVSPRRREQWLELSRQGAAPALDHDGTATVGAVARDASGHLVAITSTGGLAGQLPGRIGDSPIPGHGTWADDRCCAISTTGKGEAFMACASARHLHDRMSLGVETAPIAAAACLEEVTEVGGEGGCLVLAASGESCLSFSSPHMLRGVWQIASGPLAAIGREALG
ncbi:MAG: hypothetical protein EA402_13730 [Planctomycetota bacterium]|nr:MAG: hypothetical protein EA402_13730 [Planctomycetota bacterium]